MAIIEQHDKGLAAGDNAFGGPRISRIAEKLCEERPVKTR